MGSESGQGRSAREAISPVRATLRFEHETTLKPVRHVPATGAAAECARAPRRGAESQWQIIGMRRLRMVRVPGNDATRSMPGASAPVNAIA